MSIEQPYPTLLRDPRRNTLTRIASQDTHVHVEYPLRYCRLCAPDPDMWGPFAFPGLGTPIGNEMHTFLNCPQTRELRAIFEDDMTEISASFKRVHNTPHIPIWSTLPDISKLQILLGSSPPKTWRLSKYKTKLWINHTEDAIASFLKTVLAHVYARKQAISQKYKYH